MPKIFSLNLLTTNCYYDIIKTIKGVIKPEAKGDTIMKKVVFTGMTSEQKLDTIKALFDNNEIKKGAYVKVAYKSERKALKGYEKENGATMVEKYSEGVARLGIDYRHTSDYLTKVVAADGKDTPSRTSEYDTPLSGYENLLIKNEKEGEVRYKVKLFNSKTATRTKSKWFVNGAEFANKDDIEKVIGKQSKSGAPTLITVWLDNIISIGG